MAFEARYEGTCPAGDDIEPGDNVRYDLDDLLWHVTCFQTDQASRRQDAERPSTVCTTCWLVEPCEHSERGVVVRV